MLTVTIGATSSTGVGRVGSMSVTTDLGLPPVGPKNILGLLSARPVVDPR